MPRVMIEGVGEIGFPDSMTQLAIENGLSALKITSLADEQAIDRDARLSQGGVLGANDLANVRPSTIGSVFDTPERVESRGRLSSELALNMMPAAAITAFHGSPFRFNKFDSSKIGTGEGAQVFGHGLYFAENPATAQTYRFNREGSFPDNAASEAIKKIVGKEFGKESENTLRQFANSFSLGERTLDDAAKKLGFADIPLRNLNNEQRKNIIQAYLKTERTGSLMKVDIPDKQVAKMLDFDKPLREQSQFVKDAIKDIYEKTLEPMNRIKASRGLPPLQPDMSDTGGAFLRNLGVILQTKNSGNISGNAAEKFLKSKGIPGIRFLDQGSRQVGKGTSNFVVFDDTIPEIMEINGKPLAQKSKDILAQVGAKFVIPIN